jgi:hypothetical protein
MAPAQNGSVMKREGLRCLAAAVAFMQSDTLRRNILDLSPRTVIRDNYQIEKLPTRGLMSANREARITTETTEVIYTASGRDQTVWRLEALLL